MRERIGELRSEVVYCDQAKKYKLLSHEEHCYLANKIKEGDEEARTRMIESNLFLVISIARSYIDTGQDFSDLIQAGNLGLIRSVEKFKPEKGFKFATYARNWIKKFIAQLIDKQFEIIRIPQDVQDLMHSMYAAEIRLINEFWRSPTEKELSQATGIKLTKIQELRLLKKTYEQFR